jgi:hypothetical protein
MLIPMTVRADMPEGLTTADGLVALSVACTFVVAVTYRLRRDVKRWRLTRLSIIVAWVSLGSFVLWVLVTWLTGSRWFEAPSGAATLAAIETCCLCLMTLDVIRTRRRRQAGGAHRPPDRRRE